MALSRVIQDELLRTFETAKDQHVVQVLRVASSVVSPVSESRPYGSPTPSPQKQQPPPPQCLLGALDAVDTASKDPSERTSFLTPLLPHAELAEVVVIDVSKVEQILTAEETAAIEEDARLPALALVREESVLVAKVAVPMIIATLIEFIDNTIRITMVGHVHRHQSAQILAAYILSNLLQLLLFTCLLEGFSTAIDELSDKALASKALGDKLHANKRELWLVCQAGLVVFATIMPFVAVTFLFGAEILELCGQDAAIARIAGHFLFVSALSIPFAVAFSLMKSVLHAQNSFAPIIVALLAAWVASDSLSYVLAYHTRLGYIGLALADPLSWIVQALVLLPVVLRSEIFQQSWPGWQLQEAMARVPKIVRAGVPSVLVVAPQLIGFLFTSLLAGLLPNPSAMITANGIFTSMLALVNVPLQALAVAGSVRVDAALSSGRARRAKVVGRSVIGASVCVAGVSAVVLPHFVKWLAAAFTPDQEAIRVAVSLAHDLLPPLLPLLGAVSGVQSVLLACGKHLRAVQLTAASTFAVGVPVGFDLAVGRGGLLEGLWAGNAVGTAAAAFVGLFWFASQRWARRAHDAKHAALSY